MSKEHVSNPGSMSFPRGVPDGQMARADKTLAKPDVSNPRSGVVHDIAEAVQWGMLPAVLYMLARSVLTSGQLASADPFVAVGLATVVAVLAYVMSRTGGQ